MFLKRYQNDQDVVKSRQASQKDFRLLYWVTLCSALTAPASSEPRVCTYLNAALAAIRTQSLQEVYAVVLFHAKTSFDVLHKLGRHLQLARTRISRLGKLLQAENPQPVQCIALWTILMLAASAPHRSYFCVPNSEGYDVLSKLFSHVLESDGLLVLKSIPQKIDSSYLLYMVCLHICKCSGAHANRWMRTLQSQIMLCYWFASCCKNSVASAKYLLHSPAVCTSRAGKLASACAARF